MKIPRNLDDLDAPWLSEALGRQVVGVAAQPIAEGEGFMGRLARLTVDYGAGAEGPRTVIAKIPTDDPGGIALGQMLRVWEREARFYLDLAPRLHVRTPACHYAGGDEESGIFALLLEDLSAFTGGDQLVGATPAQAEAAVSWLARFHAAETGGGDAAGLAWLPATDTDPMYLSLQPMLEAVWPGFVEQWGGFAPPETLPWVERLIPHLTESLTERLLPPTVIHSDFRVDHLFFDGDDVIALDWQAVALGQGLYDLAYFVAGSQTVDQRRADEHALVERYRQGLEAGGIAVPGEDEMFDLYRRTMLYTMGIGALLAGQLDLDRNPRGHELGRLTIERMFIAGKDLRVAEFLAD
jgi:hypothetical protein